MQHEWRQRLDSVVVTMVLCLEVGSMTTVAAVMIHGNAPWWAVTGAFAALALPILLLGFATLRIRLLDDRLAWSFFPLWRSHVRYEDVASIRVEEVDAMRDFMGWGPKVGRNGFGAIARSGPAVRIGRRNARRDLVLTCDDAPGLAYELALRSPRAEVDAGAGAHEKGGP